MQRIFNTMLVIGAAATFFTGSFCFAADQSRVKARTQSHDQSCLTTQSSRTQSRQMSQQKLNQGVGTQTRSQRQLRGAR
jgi:hypothetical protein